MRQLIIGFDSAWTENNSGAIVAVCKSATENWRVMANPGIANFAEAQVNIEKWISECKPDQTLLMLDQPTVVENEVGQRPVETIVSSPVSLRYGGVQPANKGREGMFNENAPVWRFLNQFKNNTSISIIETYPVLSLIALNWLMNDSRSTGKLPKYNPGNKNTFEIGDWRFLCLKLQNFFQEYGISQFETFCRNLYENSNPKKPDQDKLDSCLCLIPGIMIANNEKTLIVGQHNSGYMVIPFGDRLKMELENRCRIIDKNPENWVNIFNLEKFIQEIPSLKTVYTNDDLPKSNNTKAKVTQSHNPSPLMDRGLLLKFLKDAIVRRVFISWGEASQIILGKSYTPAYTTQIINTANECIPGSDALFVDKKGCYSRSAPINRHNEWLRANGYTTFPSAK